MAKNRQQKQDNKKLLKPLSMHPLDIEDAIKGFLQTDPKKVEERLKKDGIIKKKRKKK